MAHKAIVACSFEPVCDQKIVMAIRAGIEVREAQWRDYYAEMAAQRDHDGNPPSHEECVAWANINMR